MRLFLAGILVVLSLAPRASAQTIEPLVSSFVTSPTYQSRHMSWLTGGGEADPNMLATSFAFSRIGFEQEPVQPLRKMAIEYSDAYRTRAKIHKYASFATLPLFAVELALGQALYNTPAPGWKRKAHGIVGAGIAGLFAVNTVTGAWNLFGEGRKDTNGRTLRLVHGLLMMAADVGILATTLTGPNSQSQRQALTFTARESTHRNLAIATISVGTAGYLLMIFKKH
jgi:hypothetical protein